MQPLRLGQIADEELRRIAVNAQPLCNNLRCLFGIAEDDGILRFFVTQDTEQQGHLLLRSHVEQLLIDFINRHIIRIDGDLFCIDGVFPCEVFYPRI